MKELVMMPWYGWTVILVIAILVFVILMARGLKIGIGDKVIEIAGDDGEKQQTDTFGLMYILNDNCRQIEQRKKEAIDGIIPDLVYRLSDISNVACVCLKGEAILHARRRKNGFEKLTSRRALEEYIDGVADEIERKTAIEREKVRQCAPNVSAEVHQAAIKEIAQAFTLRAIEACTKEYADKAEMYRRFMPQFDLLHDKQRVDFCAQKIKKHEASIRELEGVVAEVAA